MGATPLGSTSSLRRINRKRTASRASSSVTSATPARCCRMIEKVSSPGAVGSRPSMIECDCGVATISPCCSDRNVSFAVSGSTPKTRISGFSACAARLHPLNDAAAADGRDQHVEIGHVRQEFQRGRALPGNDVRMLERYQRQPALFAQRPAYHFALLFHPIVQHHLRAIAARRGELHRRRIVRHDDHRRRVEQFPDQGQGLRMIARRELTRRPRCLCSALSRPTALYAPRNLNAPARCKFSHLQYTSTSSRSFNVREVTTGVRWALRSIAPQHSECRGSLTISSSPLHSFTTTPVRYDLNANSAGSKIGEGSSSIGNHAHSASSSGAAVCGLPETMSPRNSTSIQC